MNSFLEIAQKAALRAGEFLSGNLDGTVEIRYKGEGYGNPFSRIDTEVEDIILGIINNAFPEHHFISEERGKKDVSSNYTWIVDPLDGTINFIHKLRHFGVSIALAYQREVILGVVYNPILDEMFTAVKDHGAHLNERRIHVSETASLGKSLLAMGFSYDRNSDAFSQSLTYFSRLARDSQAIRRDGSTALALCNVACGRYDGFCVAGNELWDFAAGTLIVAEAGGRLTNFKGDSFHVINHHNEVLATNGPIHEQILKSFQDI